MDTQEIRFSFAHPDQSEGTTQKAFLAPNSLRADPQPSGVPPSYSKQDETRRTQSFGPAVVTSPPNTKPITVAMKYRLPLVSVMDQNGSGTDMVCTANGPDLGEGSSSSDHTSISTQLVNVGKEVWEVVPSEPDSFGDNQSTMDVPTSRHEPLHTRELGIRSRVIPASVSVDPPMCGNSFVADEGGWIDGVYEPNLSDYLMSLEHRPSTTHVPNVLQNFRSSEQELKELEMFTGSNDLHDQSMRSAPVQQVIPKPPRNPRNTGSDQDSPGEYELVQKAFASVTCDSQSFTRCPTAN